MGLFYINNDEENSISYQKKHSLEIQEIAKETIDIVKNSPDSIYPDFLKEVQLNEYEGDDYKLRGTCNNPNVLKAYTIRRKYSNYWDYLDALEAYLDYVDYIDSAYGSFDMMKNASDNGVSVIYIPKKPKLTNKKSNKNLIRSKFLPSRFDEEFITDDDAINEAINNIPKNEISTDPNYKLPKNIAKLQEKEIESKIKSDRINSIYSKSGSMQGMDAIINFLNSPNSDSIDYRNNTKSSFTDRMAELHEFDYIPEDIIDDEFSPKTSYVTSSFLLDPEKQRQQQILLALTEAGYNFLDKATTKGMSKDVVRAVSKRYSNQLSENYDNLTPKQIKKLKKKEAKRRKHSKERLLMDRRLNDTLLLNRAHFTRDQNLNFRLCDVIPEDD